MPRLKRLLRPEELGDAPPDTTAERLFSSSIHSQELRTQRRAAAAVCSAPAVDMTHKIEDDLLIGAAAPDGLGEEECIAAALHVAKERGQVLFLGVDANLITKRLATAASNGMTMELAAECLHRVRFRPCQSAFELLCELSWEEELGSAGEARTRLVIVGPLCDLFSSFQGMAGRTATGAGMKRMLELAMKRLRASSGVQVCVTQPGSD